MNLREITITLPAARRTSSVTYFGLLPPDIRVAKLDCISDGKSGMIYLLEIYVHTYADKRRILKTLLKTRGVIELSYMTTRSSIIASLHTECIATCSAAKESHAFCVNCLFKGVPDDSGSVDWIMAIDDRSITNLLDSLRSNGLGIRLKKISGPSFPGRLTAIQEKALSVADALGYFNVPRLNKTKAVAAELGISVPLASERIRAAEKKVTRRHLQKRGSFPLEKLFDYLENYAGNYGGSIVSSPERISRQVQNTEWLEA